jgi:hypothetical protein
VSDSPSRASFTGLIVHRDVHFRYSILIPEGWHRLDVAEDFGPGAFYAPTTTNTLTGFLAQARDLGTTVAGEDLGALRAGFLRGLRGVPGSKIESQEADAIGTLITMEARQTYLDGAIRRKHWVRLLYQGSIQVRLIARGETVEEFQRWLPMFYETMRTFRFGDWWADASVPAWRPTIREEDVQS